MLTDREPNPLLDSGDHTTDPENLEFISLETSQDVEEADNTSKQKFIMAIAVIALPVTCLVVIIAISGASMSLQRSDEVLQLIPNVEDAIIFNPNDSRTYKQYTYELDKHVERYETAEIKGRVVSCAVGLPKEDEVCIFHASYLDDCHKENGWGYMYSKPCVLLTINKGSSFKAVGYESIDKLPSDMPEDLRHEIELLYEDEGIINDTIWVHCTGSNYYAPYQGFMVTSFHNQQSDDYLPPLVAVQFDLTNTDVLYVECGLWSKNSEVIKRSFKLQKYGQLPT